MEPHDVIDTDSLFRVQQCYIQQYMFKEQEDAYHFASSLDNYDILLLLSDTYYSSFLVGNIYISLIILLFNSAHICLKCQEVNIILLYRQCVFYILYDNYY